MPGDPIRGNVTPMPSRANGRTRNVAHRGWEDGPGFPACQWIEGDPRDRAFCGAPVLDRHDGRRSSYCPEHHARCWEPAKQMTRPTPDTVNPPGREGGQVHPKDAA